jgi:hypothetical protein
MNELNSNELTREELIQQLDSVIESDELLKAADDLLGTSLMGLAKGIAQLTNSDEEVVSLQLAQFVGALLDGSIEE